MDCKNQHEQHEHTHGANCGHTAVRDGDQVGYLHDGHMHVAHSDHYDDVAVKVSSGNPDGCTPEHACTGHPAQHTHGPNCGHEQVPHGDHVDYLVGDHLHHEHGAHCDNHGRVQAQDVKAA